MQFALAYLDLLEIHHIAVLNVLRMQNVLACKHVFKTTVLTLVPELVAYVSFFSNMCIIFIPHAANIFF